MSYDSWKLATPPDHGTPPVECEQCGDTHSPTRCSWAETCAECSRTGAEMAEPRLCVDCSDSIERAARRDRADAIRESHGDYLRDQQKGA